MKELLEALDRAGVQVTIYSPLWHSYSTKSYWEIKCSKNAEGLWMEMVAQDPDLEVAAAEAWEKWRRATNGLPSHSLRQIEAQPTPAPEPIKDEPSQINETTDWKKELNDEIPF